MASASGASRRFVSRWVRAAAFLIQMTASTNGASGARCEMGKLRRARSVWIPYSASSGTGSSPSGSRSMRVALIASVRSDTTPFVANQESPMATQDLIQHVPARAAFTSDKMTKLDCFRSDRLLVGLNCFEPGQEQPVHAHAGAGKFYIVVTGKARFILGERVREAGPGDLILAPEGVPHGIETALERTVMLVVIAPAPRG